MLCSRLGFIATVLMVAIEAANGNLAGIELTSQEYHVEGEYTATVFQECPSFPPLYCPELFADSYDLTFDAPIGGEVVFPAEDGYLLGATSSSSLFEVYAWSYDSHGGWPTSGLSSSSAYGAFDFSSISSSAQLTVEVPDFFGGSGSVEFWLDDLTEDIRLFEIPESSIWAINDWIIDPFTVELDQAHEYSMFMRVAGSANDDGNGARLQVTVSTVPVPGSLALSAVGLCLVGWLRRRH